MNTTDLQKAIQNLDRKRADKEIVLLENLGGFEKYFDPVFYMNNALPAEVPITVKINKLLDNTISDATQVINGKISNYTNDSFILRSGGNMVSNIVGKKINTNRNRIKAISLAIIKNILT